MLFSCINRESHVQAPTTPLTVEYLEQLFLRLMQPIPKATDLVGAPEGAKPDALEDT